MKKCALIFLFLLTSSMAVELVSGWPQNAKQLRGRYYVSVLGEVVHPAKIEFSAPASFWDAILKAGGTTKNAKLRNTRLIRENEDRSSTIYCFDPEEAKRKHVNIMLQADDIIYIAAWPD